MSETIDNCKNWKAIHNFMPPGPARLNVNGKCTFPTPGYKVVLKPKVPQGINPLILMLEKQVTPPTGIVAQVVTTIDVQFEETTNTRYTDVDIDGTVIKVENVY
jgi:hypothetical protein